MAKLFISYSRSNKPVVDEMIDDLTSVGHSVWIDKELTGGQSWWCKILEEIRDCDFFMAAMSESFNQSEACEKELDYALALGKTIIPIRVVDNFNDNLLPVKLGRLQIADYLESSKDGLISLIKAITNATPSPEPPSPLPDEPPLPLSYLGELAQQIGKNGALSRDEQELIIYKLGKHYTQTKESKAILQSLDQFQKRDDLLNDVGEEIKDLKIKIESEQKSSGKNPKSTSQPEYKEPTAGLYKGALHEEGFEKKISDPKETPSKEKGVVGFAILSMIFPIIGVVLFFVWRVDKPKKAKATIVAAALGMLLYILITGSTSSDYYY